MTSVNRRQEFHAARARDVSGWHLVQGACEYASGYQSPLPHNIEAEKALLGAVLVDNEVLDRVSGSLSPDHFFDPLHARIYETLTTLIKASEQHVGPYTLTSFFENAEPIDANMTVPRYLGMLASHAPNNHRDAFVLDCAKTITSLASQRALIDIGKNIGKAAQETLSTEAMAALFDDIERQIAKLREGASASAMAATSAAVFEGKPVPPREWHVPELVPTGNVTLLGGDGATGKSLLALQLAVATAVGRPWLGRTVPRGRVLFISAEDEMDELHRRLEDICAFEGISFAALHDLHLVSLAGENAVMATFDRATNIMTQTEVCRDTSKLVEQLRPILIVLDTLADLFGGDEVNRSQTRQFVQMLRGVALKFRTTVVLLAHPSVAGMKSGSGTSGSTAWSNSVRSRLYFERVIEPGGAELDPDARRLSTKKANYARTGQTIPLRWHKGVFRCTDTDTDAAADALHTQVRAETVFLELLRKFMEQGRPCTSHVSPMYAPKQFAEEPLGKPIGKQALAAAMSRLLDAKKIRVEESGSPSKRRSRLLLA